MKTSKEKIKQKVKNPVDTNTNHTIEMNLYIGDLGHWRP
jgi:hypothetical protein